MAKKKTAKKTTGRKLVRRSATSRKPAPKKLGVGNLMAAMGEDGTMDPPPSDDGEDQSGSQNEQLLA